MLQEPDAILLDRLKKEESASFELLYKFYFPAIASFIKQNNGSLQEAEDIFQEAIVILLVKVRQPHFVLTSSLKTYLFSVAKNLWLKELRDEKIMAGDEHIETIQESETECEEQNEQKLSGWFQKITSHCQKILKALFYLNEPMENLMLTMGWKNKHTAANQKYKCLEQIKKQSSKERESC